MFIRYIFIGMCVCSLAFGDFFNKEWNQNNPPTLEQSLKSLLRVNCKKVHKLKGITRHSQYKGKEAQERCLMEQQFIRAINNDDTATYLDMVAKGKESKYFLLYTTYPPRIEVTPLMAAIVLNSPKVFHLILQDSGEMSLLSANKPLYNINSIMFDEHNSFVALRLGNKIYDAHGVNALDLSAMYRRYDMFWELLQKGARYYDPKYPLTNGIVAFGDQNILELMLYFDNNFLHNFGGGNMLHFAARNGNIELIEYLVVDKKMPIDALKAGETPLDVALNAKNFQHKPQLQAAQKLIELGAKVSEANMKRLDKLIHQKD